MPSPFHIPPMRKARPAEPRKIPVPSIHPNSIPHGAAAMWIGVRNGTREYPARDGRLLRTDGLYPRRAVTNPARRALRWSSGRTRR